MTRNVASGFQAREHLESRFWHVRGKGQARRACQGRRAVAICDGSWLAAMHGGCVLVAGGLQSSLSLIGAGIHNRGQMRSGAATSVHAQGL